MKLINLLIFNIVFAAIAFSQEKVLISDSSIENSPKITYIIFGSFCASCTGNYTNMYRYNYSNNQSTLFKDTTASFFMNKGIVVCNVPINDTSQISIVADFIKQIPKSFLQTKELEKKIGCPDCFDGGGLYLEVGQKAQLARRYFIDSGAKELNSDEKNFIGLMIKTLKALRESK